MTDIVERLRAREGGGDDEEVLMREAADEIKRLRAVLLDIERIAGVFSGYPEPADALIAIMQVTRRSRGEA